MSRDIKDLVPGMRVLAKQVTDAADKLLPQWSCIVVSTFRSFAEQNKLYSQGRTTKGNIVTHAKAGESFHNVRRAFDVAFIPKGKPNVVDYSPALFQKLSMVQVPGLEWGGAWTRFKDLPHFQYTYCDKHQKNHPLATNFNEDGSCKL